MSSPSPKKNVSHGDLIQIATLDLNQYAIMLIGRYKTQKKQNRKTETMSAAFINYLEAVAKTRPAAIRIQYPGSFSYLLL